MHGHHPPHRREGTAKDCPIDGTDIAQRHRTRLTAILPLLPLKRVMFGLVVLAILVFFGLIAVLVPWTRLAVLAWLASLVLMIVLALSPWPVRGLSSLIALGWTLVIWFPDRSPFGPLSAPERACQEVVLSVSREAREAYEAGRLERVLPALLDRIDAIEPPNTRWKAVKAAQSLDLRADPPQLGFGDATDRLVSWPWRDALDARIIPLRLRIDDAFRSRRLRRNPPPGFDDVLQGMRYDYFFLRPLAKRLATVRGRDDWPARLPEAFELIALGRSVRAPGRSWAHVRDLFLETEELELEAATRLLHPTERERLVGLIDEARAAWEDLERREGAVLLRQA